MSNDTSSPVRRSAATVPADDAHLTGVERQLCVRVPVTLRRRLRIQAAQSDMTIQQLVTTYIERGLAQRS
ncbi:hypothetical protein B4N89_45140 [Embleya scabrispora]|uniref:Uncharacterized protein n=1 Tax=Embleya scabrispora TaxID=159449 RepID=A0A1T3NIK2_9ACTN|nr:hypothetical protein [Embleya scabrispora]OPC76677.1 hypothetical protein B4N89_45140 [Embleya scabrispora]